MQSLDFNKIDKNYLTITLTNGKNYLLKSPSKRLLDKILSVNSIFKNEDVTSTDINPQMIEDLYQISAEIMSTNKTNTIVTVDEINDWDIEDLVLFFNTYMNYLESITNSKN